MYDELLGTMVVAGLFFTASQGLSGTLNAHNVRKPVWRNKKPSCNSMRKIYKKNSTRAIKRFKLI